MLVSELIEETRNILLTGSREKRNKLNGAVTSSATSLTMTYALDGIGRGSKLSVDLEDMYVWDTSSLTVSPVDRGQFGSTAAAHVDGSVVYVNPKFSPNEILRAINDELVSLSSPSNGLFRVATTELTYSAPVSGYNYDASTILDVLEVRYAMPGVSGEYLLSQDWELVRNLSDEYASGSAVMVRDAFPGRTVLITAKLPFLQLASSLTADTSTTGLPETAVDILTLGAAWRLSAPREIKRNFDEVQGDTRRAEEVPPGANLGGSRELQRLRNLRIQEEATRLNIRYPKRKPRYTHTI